MAILFADIAKSTQLYEMLGDDQAQKVVGRVLIRLAEVAERYRGRVIKTIGDEIMCTFARAHDAVEAAKAMQEGMEHVRFPELPDVNPPNIYVGLHEGPVIIDGADVFGDAVIIAARMVELAKPRQILTTEHTIHELAPEAQGCAACVDTTNIKGRGGEIKIYEVVWEQQDQTVMVDSLIDSQTFRLHMEVRFRHQVFEVDSNRPVLTLGRQTHNDVVIDDSRVSRSHSRIEYRRGKFILVDQSSNGTYVLPHGGKSTKLRKDETPLLGHGIISLGRVPDAKSPDIVHFMIKA